jgi:hypothetical protein
MKYSITLLYVQSYVHPVSNSKTVDGFNNQSNLVKTLFVLTWDDIHGLVLKYYNFKSNSFVNSYLLLGF